MRNLTLWSTTLLSQVVTPSSSTTTTSERPLKFSSRSPPATAGPRTCMTRRSVTTPSVERSLHHCSLRSEKNQRAVDKLITLMKKVCCQLSNFLHTQERRDMFLKLLSLITRGGTPRPLGSYARYQGLIASLLTYLWLRREIFTATPLSSRTWGTGPFRVITRRYVLSFTSRQIEDTRANSFQAGCPNILFSAPSCKDFTMTTVFLLIRLVHSLNLKFSYTRPTR